MDLYHFKFKKFLKVCNNPSNAGDKILSMRILLFVSFNLFWKLKWMKTVVMINLIVVSMLTVTQIIYFLLVWNLRVFECYNTFLLLHIYVLTCSTNIVVKGSKCQYFISVKNKSIPEHLASQRTKNKYVRLAKIVSVLSVVNIIFLTCEGILVARKIPERAGDAMLLFKVIEINPEGNLSYPIYAFCGVWLCLVIWTMNFVFYFGYAMLYFIYQIRTFRDCLVRFKESTPDDINQICDPVSQDAIFKGLRTLVKYHARLKSSLRYFINTFKDTMLSIVIAGTVTTCSFMISIKLNVAIFGIVFETIFCCLIFMTMTSIPILGQIIEDEYDKILTTASWLPWYNWSIKNRKVYLVFITNLESEKIHLIPGTVLNFQVFKKIFNSVFAVGNLYYTSNKRH